MSFRGTFLMYVPKEVFFQWRFQNNFFSQALRTRTSNSFLIFSFVPKLCVRLDLLTIIEKVMKNGKTILFPKSQLSQENVTKGSVSQTVPNECWRIAIAKLAC